MQWRTGLGRCFDAVSSPVSTGIMKLESRFGSGTHGSEPTLIVRVEAPLALTEPATSKPTEVDEQLG